MSYLLDTHIAVWAVSEPDRLSTDEKQLFASEPTKMAISVVTLWEIAIKRKQSRARTGQFRISASEAYILFNEAKFTILPVLPTHIMVLETLLIDHSDPFDRLLIAQALAEDLSLITRDAIIRTYLV